MTTQIDRKQIKFLWETNRWDGPLSGHAEYNGQFCYWVCVDEDWKTKVRRYLLYWLTEEEAKYAQDQHEKFQRYVGTHCNHNPDGTRIENGKVHSQEHHSKFYDEFGWQPQESAKKDFTKHLSSDRIVGSFVW